MLEDMKQCLGTQAEAWPYPEQVLLFLRIKNEKWDDASPVGIGLS